VQCHNPHGTSNIKLVRETICTEAQVPCPQGSERQIRFDNESGERDGSFASLSEPGTGVCEICHIDTDVFKADGTGEDNHWVFLPRLTTPSCVACHQHPRGFMPPNL
jgi:hypothetical protein